MDGRGAAQSRTKLFQSTVHRPAINASHPVPAQNVLFAVPSGVRFKRSSEKELAHGKNLVAQEESIFLQTTLTWLLIWD